MATIDEIYMKRCFQLAKCGFGNVAPNPMVGAVVVHDGKIIGEGFHRKYGEPHAEVNAINSVADKSLLCKATIYVNLEPCSHYGKTPPCSKLIIDCKIPNVVICNKDPFPEVSGRGIKMLQDAGVNVTVGVLEEEGWELNRRFFTFHTLKRPYIILKFAQSANGFMDGSDEKPLKISTDKSIILSHKMRTQEAAILVGTNTAIKDNPSLTARFWKGNNPTRVLIDRDLKVPAYCNIFNEDTNTIVFTEKEFASADNRNVKFVCDAPFCFDKKLDLNFLAKHLYENKLQSLIVEGGSATLQSFIDANLWDEIRTETNPDIFVKDGVKSPRFSAPLFKKEVVDGNTISWFRNTNHDASVSYTN